MKRKKWISSVCDHCGQTKDYALPLARGTALMVLALFNAVRKKNKNRVHVGDEMVCDPKAYRSYRDMVQDGKMTFKMEGNMTTLHRHGLAAKTDDEGVWLLTKKGAKFLRGEPVPRVAIIDKTTGHKAFYLDEQNDVTTFGELMRKETPFWDIPAFDVEDQAITFFAAPQAPLFELAKI